jgi:hypothetical protein
MPAIYENYKHNIEVYCLCHHFLQYKAAFHLEYQRQLISNLDD